jgi:hypothetical protein
MVALLRVRCEGGPMPDAEIFTEEMTTPSAPPEGSPVFAFDLTEEGLFLVRIVGETKYRVCRIRT